MRFKKGSKEAKEWGAKMKAAREAKKAPKIVAPDAPDFLVEIIDRYFPKAGLKVVDRGNGYSVQITIKERDVRAFVVDKMTAQIEAENWCKKIKASIEGKPLATAVGIGLQTGLRQSMKKLPQDLGSDKQFFFRE